MRILTGMWWFFALMMLSTYTANLAAFLTSNKWQSSIKSLQDLIEQDEVAFGSMRGGSTSLFYSGFLSAAQGLHCGNALRGALLYDEVSLDHIVNTLQIIVLLPFR